MKKRRKLKHLEALYAAEESRLKKEAGTESEYDSRIRGYLRRDLLGILMFWAVAAMFLGIMVVMISDQEVISRFRSSLSIPHVGLVE